MEVKLFFKFTIRKTEKFLSVCVWFCLLLFLAGCIRSPEVPDTLEEFRELFEKKKDKPLLLSGNILTLENAIKAALVNNPTNLAAAQAVLAAKHEYYQSLSAYFPEINAGYSLTQTLSRGWDLKNPPEGMLRKNDHFITSGTVQSSLLLFDGFARELEVIIAQQEYNKSAAASKNVRRLLTQAVAFAYYDMYQANEEINIFNADLSFQRDALHQEEQRFRSGHVSKASVLNFRILAAKAQSSISNASYRRQTALHALTALLGCDRKQLPDDLQLQKIITEHLPYLQDDDFYLELAVNNRPDLKEEKIMLDIAGRRRQKVYADFLPEIHLFSDFSLETYNARYGHYRVSDSHGSQRGFSYGAEMKWNLFRGFYSVNKLRRQEILEKIAFWGLNTRFLEIAAEVRNACADCKNACFQVKIFQDMAQWVREQRDLVFSEYRNGRETITRLNEAQSILIEAQNRLIISAVQLNKASIQLAVSTGTEISDVIFWHTPPPD